MRTPSFRLNIASCATALCSVYATAQCPRWEKGPLIVPDPSPNGQVLAMTSWDPDGAGPAMPLLVIGGTFTSIGGVAANRVAAFNGFHWSPLAVGFNDTVHALGVFNGQLIAGGDFTNTGGFPVNHIARFNGATWSNLGMGTSGGGFAGRVSALTVFNNELIVGGSFTNAGGFVTSCIARWNGSIWGTLGTGGGMALANNSPGVQCLTVFNGQLYAGGLFDSAGGTSVNNVARWNGSAWNNLGLSFGGNGADGLVRCFLVHDFGGALGVQLVVGGSFSSVSIGGVTINSAAVARWSGGSWGGFGGGIPGATVGGLASDGSGFIAGGFFPGPFNSIARWNASTSSWEAFESGVALGSVQVMLNYHQQFASGFTTVVGGAFQGIGGLALNNFARVTYPDFRPLDSVFEPFAFANLGSRLIAGGYGSQPSQQGFPAFIDNIMAWDGVKLSPLADNGLNGWANAMVARVVSPTSNSLVVGGWFSMAGGIPANNVALWTESTSTPPVGSWASMGAGFNNEVLAMTVFRSNFVAGGGFTTSGGTVVNGMARWNGAAWTPFTSGLNNGASTAKALAFTTRTIGPFDNQQHQLIVGGSFTTAGGVAANNIAVWFENVVNHPLNGWFTLGSGFDGNVYALAMHGGSIYAGGGFTHSGNGVTQLNHIARWTGSTWEQVGPGLPSTAFALLSKGGFLYAMMSGSNAGLVKWDGATWSTIEGGVQSADGSSNLFAMGAYHNEIHVGGRFDTVNFGTLASPGWARFLETAAPWIAQQPSSQSVGCGNNATFSVQAAIGYTDLTHAWQRDGVPLGNGPTGNGSSISGANAPTLSITNVQAADIGDFECVLSNTCGGETSAIATLTINNGSFCCPADITSDGIVNINDLLVVISFWGPCPGGCDADIAPPGGDGNINITDLLAVISGWGACPQ